MATTQSLGREKLAAYCNQPVRAQNSAKLIAELRRYLHSQVPDYMVPSTFVVMPNLPLTPNGKVNRKALPTPQRERTQTDTAFVSPRTAMETNIAELWAAILSLDKIGVEDNFFDLGGHSLLAAELMFRLQEQFEVELSLINIFLCPTVEKQAELICDRKSGIQQEETQLDLWAEATLPDDIQPDIGTPANSTDPEAVLLTGATGFLGAYLLHETLAQTNATVYCLVRAKDTASAQQRIQKNLDHFSLWQPALAHRIVPVPGNLSKPQLGLSTDQFQYLADTVDIIYHNGAMVNFMHPYTVMKATNVTATETIIRLASRSKVKPIHFLSTLGVFSPIAYEDNQLIVEDDEPSNPSGLYGYTQSKWVAEKLLTIAQQRGIPSTIYRPAWIEGHSKTGVCNSNDFLRGLIKGCIQLGLAPDWPMGIDVVPVDYIGKAIVHFSCHQTANGQTYNFVNAQAIDWNQLVDWIDTYGYPLKRIPYRDWLDLIKADVKPGSDNALAPFLAFLTELSPEYDMTIPEMYFKAQGLRFEKQKLNRALEGWADPYPAVLDVLPAYFDYFIRSGFLAPPAAVPKPI